jgi:hypothetical protein
VKSGLEQRGKVIFAIVLGVIALFAFWTMLRSRPTVAGATAPATATAQPIAPRAVQAKRRQRPGMNPSPSERSLDPTLRLDYLRSEKVEYKGSRCNIFSGDCEKPIEPKPVVPKPNPNEPQCPNNADPRCPPVCPGPDPRCPPPPIPLQFFGFASKPGEPKRVFLRTTDTNDVFVAGEGEVVNRRYRVLRIMGSGVEVEDVLNSNKQVLPFQQGG